MATTETTQHVSAQCAEQDPQSSVKGLGSDVQLVDKQYQVQANDDQKNMAEHTAKETPNDSGQSVVIKSVSSLRHIKLEQAVDASIQAKVQQTDELPKDNPQMQNTAQTLVADHQPAVMPVKSVLYLCSLCNMAVPNVEALHKHMKQSHRNALHPCTVCGMYFISETFLSNHTCTVMPTKPAKRHKCQYCPLEYKAEGKLKNHLRNHHTEEERIYTCKVCELQFDVKLHLTEHMKTHITVNPFQCGLCALLFDQGRSLTKHLHTQHGVDNVTDLDPQEYGHPYQCAVCGKGFLSNSYLSMHVQRHTGKYSFKCSICPKGFSQNRALQRHLKQHAKKNPFKCKICGKELGKRYTLVAHMRQHDKNRKTYKCHVCEREFTQKSNRNHHIRVDHKGQCVPPVSKTESCTESALQIHSRTMPTFNDTSMSQTNVSHRNVSEKWNSKGNILNTNSVLSQMEDCEEGDVPATPKDSVLAIASISHTNISQTNAFSRTSIPNFPIGKPVMLYKCSACKQKFDDKNKCESHLETHNAVTGSVSNQNLNRRSKRSNRGDISKSHRVKSDRPGGFEDTVDSRHTEMSENKPLDCEATGLNSPKNQITDWEMVQETTELLDKSIQEAGLSEVNHDSYKGSERNCEEGESTSHDCLEWEEFNNSGLDSEQDVDSAGDVSEDVGGTSESVEKLSTIDDLIMTVTEDEPDTPDEVTLKSISKATSKANTYSNSRQPLKNTSVLKKSSYVAVNDVASEGCHAGGSSSIEELVSLVSQFKKVDAPPVNAEKKTTVYSKQKRQTPHYPPKSGELCRTITTLHIPCKFSLDPSKRDTQKTLTLYQCDDCKIRFFDKSVCDEHIERKHARDVGCNLCMRSFDTDRELATHISTTAHSNRKRQRHVISLQPSGVFINVQPTQDDATTMSLGVPVSSDVSIAEQDMPQKSRFEEILRVMFPTCGVCGKTFSGNMFVEKASFRHHLLSHSYTGNWPPKCDVCSETFKKEQDLQWHMYKHTNAWPHKCDLCGKGFYDKTKLQVHMGVHTNAKPHKCSMCDRAFGQKGDLKKHMRLHTGIKPFQCHVCGKAFADKGNMTRHALTHQTSNDMKPHSDQPSFLCDLCGSSFKSKQSCSKHIERHNTDEAGAVKVQTTPSGVTFYPCHVCLDAFRSAAALTRHTAKYHAENEHTQAAADTPLDNTL